MSGPHGLRWASTVVLLVGALGQPVTHARASEVAAIRLSPAVGPPTTATVVRGRGFFVGETVDLTFDGALLAMVQAGGTGGFMKQIQVPTSAIPGDHTVQATGESSGQTATATFKVRTDWTKFHFDDASTGYNPYENVLGPGNVGDLQVSWTVDAGAQIQGGPAVVGGIAYVSGNESVRNDTRVLAIDTATGSVIWHRNFVGGAGGSDPAVWGGAVYVSSTFDYAMFALSARTGKTLWVFPASGALSAPVVADGVLYTASNAGQVFALDAKTGEQIWATGVLGTFFAGMAIAGGRIYIGSWDQVMYALDQATGQVVWSVPTPLPIRGLAAVAEGRVFVGCANGRVLAFDAASGAQLWSYPTAEPITSGPAIWQGNVYVGTEGDGLYAFDAVTGVVVWHAPALGSMVQASPVVANGVVYVGTKDDSVYAFDALTGDQLWSYQTGALINSSPAVADGVLYIGSFDESVYAFQLP